MIGPLPSAILLLIASNVFMTFARYAHLKNMSGRAWSVAAPVSWGIALSVFVPFMLLYMRQPLKLDYLWASLCMLGAVYFMFRES